MPDALYNEWASWHRGDFLHSHKGRSPKRGNPYRRGNVHLTKFRPSVRLCGEGEFHSKTRENFRNRRSRRLITRMDRE
jgi:hypothetical protein